MTEAPLLPEGIGEVLHAILHPEFPPGPPYTHTFRPPPTEYDTDGEPQPPQIQPTLILERLLNCQDRADGAVAALLRIHRRRRPDLHPLLLDHGIDRDLALRTSW